MKNYILIILALIFFSGCFNKHGISLKYYTDCTEYYDLQGYYHKECGKDDIVSYKELREKSKKAYNSLTTSDDDEVRDPSLGKVW